MRSRLFILASVFLVLVSLIPGLVAAQSPRSQAPMGTAFTYQARLNAGGSPAEGLFDFEFRLYDAAAGGTQVGGPISRVDMPVSRGLFTVSLDFGPAFTGQAVWLEVAVKGPGDTVFTTLSPRQALMPTPYALHANHAADANTAGELKTEVGGIRLEPGGVYSGGPNVIGGFVMNRAIPGAYGATIGGGGGQLKLPPDVGYWVNTAGNYATVGGGADNHAEGENSIVGGGFHNTASEMWSTVGGGISNAATHQGAAVAGGGSNTAEGGFAFVGGGDGNRASDWHSTVSGGEENLASAEHATVGGGLQNTASGEAAVIGGGKDNAASARYTTVGGGVNNAATFQFATIGGGWSNTASGDGSLVAGGVGNRAQGLNATVAGGNDNRAGGEIATVAGGRTNNASTYAATIGGGASNQATGERTTVGGGTGNNASAYAATIAGGMNNIASATRATVGGGQGNTASGPHATVPGGDANTAQGSYSLAAGRRAKALNTGCFVWGDSTDADITCSTNNAWLARATGGVYFYTNTALTSGVRVLPGASAWSSVSDRKLKENFAIADGQAVLERLSKVPITTWNYKAQDDTIRHMGPMAQDFYAAFGLGEDETLISTIDADGVALAAIQGLYTMAKSQASRIQQLETENADLKQQMSELQTRLANLEAIVSQMKQQRAGGQQ
ncbi:MAG: tail fiber domain-containing protein [Chloroflexi bacterium]|nr:tail fiber domain-containing protein [Chloroflexota bacterium]